MTVGVCLAKGLDENVYLSKTTVCRTVSPSITTTLARHLLSDGKKKLDRLESEDLWCFGAVDQDAKR